MREIKFRAYDKELKKMGSVTRMIFSIPQCGNAAFAVHCNDGFPEEERFSGGLESDDGNLIIMQFTGLKDKNGKEIFEGDIFKGFMGCICVVKFGDYSAGGLDYYASSAYGFYGENQKNKGDDQDLDYAENEVIGNIYENPELL